MLSRKLLVSTVAALASAPTLVYADSQLAFGPAGTTATADLAFRVTIPNFVYFQVGSAGAVVDRVDFDLAAAAVQPGAGGNVVANGGVGDGADGSLSVTLSTNAANVSIAATGGNLVSGGNNIPLTQINRTDGGQIPMPAFGGSGNLAFGAPGTRTDTWSYNYNNNTVYPAGTYNATVVYTVTVL
jgi:hypothetical protein